MAPHHTSPEAPEKPESQLARITTLSLVIVVVLLGVGFGAFKVLEMQAEPPERAAIAPVRTAVHVLASDRGPHREMLTGYGRARPLRRAAVPAEITASVRWVSPRLEAGMLVEQGEELVRLDPRDARAAADEAAARLAQAEARLLRARGDRESLTAQIAVAQRELTTSERELDRILELESKATSASEVDAQRMSVAIREQALLGLKGRRTTAEADERTAEAEIAAARSALEKARHDVERATVVAPYAGTIVERNAQPGERVSAGTTLFTIVDLRHVEIPVSLPASRHGEVAVGATALVRLREGGDVVWSGAVSRVSPNVDTERRVFEAFLDVIADDGRAAAVIAPGSFTVATVEGRLTEDVVAVPREAFVAGAIFVAEPDGPLDEATRTRPALIHERHPTVVRRLPDVVLIGDGLDDGDLVVVTGVNEVADGARVLVLEDAAVTGAGGAER